ncbi:hypothetical protein RJ640_009853 [Escallonia rubra]|uniref:Uncharacterized protein n=1 Tax=Escallonia rubra TaxID=112253 RepID=A0AA88QI98_9ASTE|nr:hypothetical protein RJ640_009853 [Escallonia rubra]
MQSELLQPSWQLFNINNSTLDQYGLYCLNADSHVDYDHGFSSSIPSPEDSSEISSVAYCPAMFLDDFPDFPILGNAMQVTSQFENIVQNMEGLEAISGTTIDDMCRWLDERDDMETDSQLSLSHRLEGYAEAIEMEQGELAEVIVNCICEKVNPVGETLERIAFNLFQSNGNQGDYLRQESSKNYESALQVFYQSFPYGRFAHFAANSAIFEAMPDNLDTLCIVDFDMGEGVQWPPIMEAIGPKKNALRLTSIRSEEHHCDFAPPQWRFEETRRRLYHHAKSVGLKLKVEEMRLGDLVRENEETKKKWEDIRESSSFQAVDGMEGWRLSKESLKEVKEMVKEGETSYMVKMEGQNENEMVLEWRGTSLVRVSTWA